MLDYELIVVPIDFSDHSMRALSYAIGLAGKYASKLRIVYVNEPSLGVSDVAWVGVSERAIKDDHIRCSRETIQSTVCDKIPDGLEAECIVLEGDAVDEIIRYADRVEADLIVMATHGRSGISHVLMGSTAEQVIRRSTCPVLSLKQPMPVTP